MRCCSFMADALNADAILPPQCPSPMVKNLNWGYLIDGLRFTGYNIDAWISGGEICEDGACFLYSCLFKTARTTYVSSETGSLRGSAKQVRFTLMLWFLACFLCSVLVDT